MGARVLDLYSAGWRGVVQYKGPTLLLAARGRRIDEVIDGPVRLRLLLHVLGRSHAFPELAIL